MTLFLENPFFVLGVTPESSRSEILAKAEEAALLMIRIVLASVARPLRIPRSALTRS